MPSRRPGGANDLPLMTALSDFRAELRPMFRLAWPVATAELGWMAMGLVDTMFVGRVGAEALGAVSIGSHVFFAVALFGMGMLLGLDYLVSFAHGAGRLADARRALVQGSYLAVALAVVLTGVILVLEANLDHLGVQPAVVAATRPYLHAVTWSMLPLLLFSTLRRYLQALAEVRVIVIALISANVLNAAVDWVLVFGRLGFPALGAEGAGWATTAARVYLFLFLLAYVVVRERRGAPRDAVSLRFEPRRFVQVARLGAPAALQLVLESGVFAAATVLAGGLTASALAAHQVALSAASMTFMVPLGISSAAAVRVGHALGRGQPAAAGHAGWSALLLAVVFMSGAALVFLFAPRAVFAVFTDAPDVIAIGVGLLAVAAAFQLFDGLQVVATGALRGLGDTRTPMLANLLGHWFLGLPIGALLCFRAGWGVTGLWLGLCIGLTVVAVVLITIWRTRAAQMGKTV